MRWNKITILLFRFKMDLKKSRFHSISFKWRERYWMEWYLMHYIMLYSIPSHFKQSKQWNLVMFYSIQLYSLRDSFTK